MMPPSKPQPAIPLWLPGNLSERLSSSLDAHDLLLRLFDDCAPGLRRYVGSFGLGSAVADDVVQQLLRILQAMPKRDRQCVYLRAEGLGYREIATTLGISLGSVAKLLGRAFSRFASVDRG